MNYARNYLNVSSLAEKIRQSASVGKVEKAAGGLAARERRREMATEEPDFEVIRAQYMNMVQDMFSEAAPVEERANEINDYFYFEEGIPIPERNPEYWESAEVHAPISAEVSDAGIRRILETIKGRESGGNYSVQNAKGSASGGYQFIDSTWKSLTQKFGIGTEYTSAKDAPPEVQDAVAAAYVSEILAQNNNDVTKVPLVWYTGNAAGKMSAEALAANNGLTAVEYQNKWLRTYNKMSGEE